MSSADVERFKAFYRDGLRDNTLGFCFPHCVNEELGGHMIARDRSLATPAPPAKTRPTSRKTTLNEIEA